MCKWYGRKTNKCYSVTSLLWDSSSERIKSTTLCTAGTVDFSRTKHTLLLPLGIINGAWLVKCPAWLNTAWHAKLAKSTCLNSVEYELCVGRCRLQQDLDCQRNLIKGGKHKQGAVTFLSVHSVCGGLEGSQYANSSKRTLNPICLFFFFPHV